MTRKSLFNPNHYLVMMLMFASFVLPQAVKAQLPKKAPTTLDKNEPWGPKDLIEPADLALILSGNKKPRPIVLNIGVVEDIKDSKSLGAASKKDNLERLKDHLKTLPKNSMVVIYCGCCPFEKCPNVRPAFTAMKNMGFLKGKLLNIPVNIKQDWINKGYPML